MLNIWSVRNNYWKNGTQWIGRIAARVIGENNYEFVRLEKRIFYANYYYTKQLILNKMAHHTPDIVNAFGVLQKEDTSHGFPNWRPHERNSDWALYNINSEGWFQVWSTIMAIIVVLNWFWIADQHYSVSTTSIDDEDLLRLKDAKATMIWERTFWSFTYGLHGQHASAYMRELKYYTLTPDNPQLNSRATFNRKNPYATDRYYKGWGEMRDMRLL
uniref:Uncharacterized protein n=1 Tax=Euplotes harpa TaxID=151035 RepID=A0A7S3JMP4_9SPIT|mmetsp:Transcript_580/g.591  ORF Transcript_580/g.591 Transcript_580/m.591 type:complete len:216 (+) Transcript_580:14-661(+)